MKEQSISTSDIESLLSHTGDVLVTTQGRDDDGSIGKLLTVLGGGREETLKQGSGRIKDSGTLATGLHTDMNLLEVHEVGGDLGDLGVTAPSEVGVTKESSQGVRLVLKKTSDRSNETR